MDINRIRYFLTLTKTGHLGRAAELHRISAPAFSKAMKVFGEEVGKELLVPEGRGIVLTDEARALVPRLEDIIGRIDRLTAGDEVVEERIRIATFEVFSTYFMEELLPEYFPDRKVLLLEMTPGKMEAAVSSGVVDYALTYNPIPSPGIDILKIQKIEMGIFGRKNLLQKELSELPFVVPVAPVEGSPSKVRGLDGWPDDRLPRLVKYQVELMESAMGLCRRGLAVAYLPKFVVSLHNEKVKAEFRLDEYPGKLKVKGGGDFIYLVKRKSSAEDAVFKRIAAAVRKITSGNS